MLNGKKNYNSVERILRYDCFQCRIAVPGRLGGFEEYEVPFSYACPFEALDLHLRTLLGLLQFKLNLSLGIELGTAGFVLPIIIMGDAGGGVMPFFAEFCSFEGARQSFTTSLGEFKGKESHYNLLNTVIPHIAKGVEKCNAHYAIIFEWASGFDFVFIPKNKWASPVSTAIKRRQLPSGISSTEVASFMGWRCIFLPFQ